MIPNMTLGNSVTTKSAIDIFENKYSVSLPETYRKFLLKTNGGRPENAVFPIRGLALNPFGSVNCFFGLDPIYKSCDLSRWLDWFDGRIPLKFIPIADNGGVDYICLDLRSNNERVVFWDHAHFWSTGEWRESDLYLIADTFDKFLSSLTPSAPQ